MRRAAASIALAVVLTTPISADPLDPSCKLTEVWTCWQGCYRTNCGGLGGGTGIQFAAGNWGLWYSTCSTTGTNCGMGHACQWMSLVLTYQDCIGSYQFLMIQPCCEAGAIWLGNDKQKPETCALPEDGLLPQSVTVPYESYRHVSGPQR